MMRRYYKLDIITTLFKKRQYAKAVRTAWIILLSSISPCRRLIYQKNSDSLIDYRDSSDFQILHFTSAAECKASLGEILASDKSLKFSFKEYTVQRRCLWLGLMDNAIVFIACTSPSRNADYFFALKDNEESISRCQTHMQYRGHGLYVRGLKKIMLERKRKGVISFYIDCHEWNWPSRIGIEKAGFKLIGYGWDKKGELSFKPL